MMRAKLSGFTESPIAVGRRYPQSDKSLPAQYARAIVAYRTGSTRDAVRAADALIAQMPSYPYFYELKGQILLEAGKARDAIAPLRKAVALAPKAGLIRIMLGARSSRAATSGLLAQAVADLRAGLADEPLAAIGYRQLAMAYQQQGKVADAELATAEGMLIAGDVKDARRLSPGARRRNSPPDRPDGLRPDDIIGYQSPDEPAISTE